VFWDLVLTEIEWMALNENLAQKCPIVKRENCSYEDVIREVLEPENDDLGVEKDCEGCPYLINAPDFLNCSLIAQEMSHKFNGFSPSETAEMLGITKSAMEKLESRILTKLIRNTFNDPRQKEFREYLKKRFKIR